MKAALEAPKDPTAIVIPGQLRTRLRCVKRQHRGERRRNNGGWLWLTKEGAKLSAKDQAANKAGGVRQRWSLTLWDCGVPRAPYRNGDDAKLK